MPSLKSFLLYGLLFVSSSIAAPATAVNETELASPLQARKHDYKCEVHFHIDSSNKAADRDIYTEKWRISLLSKGNPPSQMGYDYTWNNVGDWVATNPDYQIKIKTTHGLELWVDGVFWKGLYETSVITTQDVRRRLTFHYGSQHFSGFSCENWAFKEAGQSNGWRIERDIRCEFDC